MQQSSSSYGTVIFLNGTSSSGKSSVLKAVQNTFEEPFLDLGLDRFLWMLPERYLERPWWDDVLGKATQAGSTGRRLIHAMHASILAVSRQGNPVVADHVLVEPAWVMECIELFAELPVWLVGVRCPLAVVEERERRRKNRTLGQARAQFEVVHQHSLYDIEVDTSKMNPQECAEKIKAEIINQMYPRALRELRERLAADTRD